MTKIWDSLRHESPGDGPSIDRQVDARHVRAGVGRELEDGVHVLKSSESLGQGSLDRSDIEGRSVVHEHIESPPSGTRHERHAPLHLNHGEPFLQLNLAARAGRRVREGPAC
jgi:hypothetical protein